MSWVLDGQKVKAKYLGETVTGVVVDSRVKYGGKVQYTVELDSPVQFRWRSEPTDRVLIDNDELLENN
jgi:hypothetical protein